MKQITFKLDQVNDVWLGQCVESGTATFANTWQQCCIGLIALTEFHMEAPEEVQQLHKKDIN